MTETDDTPLWVEVWGMWFSLGMCLRSWTHIWVASDIDNPDRLSLPIDDRTLRSPVAEIRGTRLELFAVILTAIHGILFWVFLPLIPPSGGLAPLEYAAGVWLTMQAIPLLGDPVGLALAQYRTTDTAVKQPTPTND